MGSLSLEHKIVNIFEVSNHEQNSVIHLFAQFVLQILRDGCNLGRKLAGN